MSDKCPNCGFEVTLSPRERRSLIAEIQQKEAKRRALWDALVSAYKREGCGLGEAQILADVVMDSASDRLSKETPEQALERKQLLNCDATKQGPRCRDHDIVDCIECAIDCLKALPTVESGQ